MKTACAAAKLSTLHLSAGPTVRLCRTTVERATFADDDTAHPRSTWRCLCTTQRRVAAGRRV